MPQHLFVFVQFEFPWLLGPAAGRYLVRRGGEGEPEHVVVLTTVAAGRQPSGARPGAGPWRMRRGPRTAPTGPEPAAVPTTRVTVIDPVSLGADSQARAWLEGLDVEREITGAAGVVNRVVHSHRIAAADPYTYEVSPAQALVIRAGWGEGEQVADGRWLHARALPLPERARGGVGGRRRARASALRPQERMAALLGARSTPLVCEELVLRARQDLDHGRPAHAALELEQAYALAVAELGGEERPDLALRVTELARLQAGVQEQARLAYASAAQAAAPSGRAEDRVDEDVLTHALERLEAALRARTAAAVPR